MLSELLFLLDGGLSRWGGKSLPNCTFVCGEAEERGPPTALKEALAEVGCEGALDSTEASLAAWTEFLLFSA